MKIFLDKIVGDDECLSEQAKPLNDKEFAGYFYLDRDGKREIYAPDIEGGHYLRKTISPRKD